MFRITFLAFFMLLAISVSAQSKVDSVNVAQMSIDLPEFQTYLHPEASGRKPFVMYDNGVVPNHFKLIKFGEAVQFWSKSQIFFYGQGALIFDKFNFTTTTAEVSFYYPVEGLRIDLGFEKKDGVWAVKSQVLTEQ